jgi:hypothetical protein
MRAECHVPLIAAKPVFARRVLPPLRLHLDQYLIDSPDYDFDEGWRRLHHSPQKQAGRRE